MRCRAWLQDALERGGHKYRLIDVYKLVESGDAMLWAGSKAAFVSEVRQYPQWKALNLWLAGGDLKSLLAAEPAIVEMARANDCKFIEIAGRRGWLRALNSFNEIYTMIARPV